MRGWIHFLCIEWKRNYAGKCASWQRSICSLNFTLWSFLVPSSSPQESIGVGEIALLRPGVSCMFTSTDEFQFANLSVSKRNVDSQEFLKKVIVHVSPCLREGFLRNFSDLDACTSTCRTWCSMPLPFLRGGTSFGFAIVRTSAPARGLREH